MALEIDNWPDEDGTHIVVPTGELDTQTAPSLGACIDAIIDGGGRQVVLDLSGVDYMDSSGLVAVMSATNRLRKAAGDLRVAAPSTPVQRLFGLTRMDSVFAVFGTREAALHGPPPGDGAPPAQI